jgi:hypothetical protein
MSIRRDYAQYLGSLGSHKFRALWPGQAYALSQYSATFADKRDLAIELPTGQGKTLISLLIAGAWLEAGRKVAVLSANKTLARQMARESQALGIPVAYMEGRADTIPVADRRRYQRAQSVGIMNYWVYINQNPVVDPADLVIMDDAHLAEHCLHSLYSVEITRYRHADLFRTLIAELQIRFPEYSVLSDALSDSAPPTSTAELISFIDQVDVSPRLREVIDASPLVAANDDLRFRWHHLRDKLVQVNLYVSRGSIWLRPYVYPLVSNSHYADTTQVLYMSATIGDPGDLARRLGVRRIEKVPIPPHHAEATSGRRLVVMNRTSDEQDIPSRVSGALLAAIRTHPKSLWLCASDTEAAKYQQVVMQWLANNGVTGHQSWLLTSLGDEIDQFRAAPAGHLFVAGRFDGMDFEGSQCRIVMVTTLPRAINLQEEFITSYLRDAGFMRRRLNQRIVQALGRCNRAGDDYGVYFLADQRFATHFSREANREGISSNVQAELDLAQDLAEKPDTELADYVVRFLTGHVADFDRDLSTLRVGVPAPRVSGQVVDTSANEVIGWAALTESNYPLAGERFEACWDVARAANLLEIGALHGWHRAKALYLAGQLGDATARQRALDVLEEAIRRGGQSSWFNRQRASLGRARADFAATQVAAAADYADTLIRTFDDLLEKLGTRGDKFQRELDKTSLSLTSMSHAQYQEGLERLGTILGFSATRPKYGAATDCRWRGVFGNARELITFEAKIEHTPSGTITAADVGQAHVQYARGHAEFGPQGYTVRGTIATHMTQLHGAAVSGVGALKIVRKDAVGALWERVVLLLSQYRAAWSLDDIAARRRAAAALRPKLPSTGWVVRALDAGAPWVASDQLLVEWRTP